MSRLARARSRLRELLLALHHPVSASRYPLAVTDMPESAARLVGIGPGPFPVRRNHFPGGNRPLGGVSVHSKVIYLNAKVDRREFLCSNNILLIVHTGFPRATQFPAFCHFSAPPLPCLRFWLQGGLVD